MKTRMTHAGRAELANPIRSMYSAATGSAKRKILDEFIAASRYHEKSAIRVLNGTPIAKERQSRKRPLLHDETSRAALVVREGSLVVEALDRIRAGPPFALQALDADNVLRANATPIAGNSILARNPGGVAS